MDFLVPIPAIIATQSYWASLIFIGYVFALIICDKDRAGIILNGFDRLPFLAKISISLAMAMAIFSVWTIVGYAVSAPAWWLSFSYLVTSASAIGYALFYLRDKLLQSIRSIILQLTSLKLLSFPALLIVILCIDYVLSLMYGAALWGDGYVHMSKVLSLAQNGFVLTDAFFGTVPETRHAVSILHTLVAIPVYFGIDSINSWLLTLAPLKLFAWSTIYYLVFKLISLTKLKSEQRTALSALAVIIAVVLPSMINNFYAIYPNRLVLMGVCLLLIGLIEVLSRKGWLILIVASLIIAMNHTLISLGVCFAYAVIALGFVVFDRSVFNKGMIIPLLISGMILAIAPLFSYLLPNQMSEAAQNYGVDSYNYTTVFGVDILTPSLAQYATNSPVPIALSLIGLLGLVGLIFIVKGKRNKVVIASFVLIVPLIVYNPLTTDLLRIVLPDWAIRRFLYLNPLTFISIFFGFVVIALSIRKYFTKKYTIPSLVALGILLVATALQPFSLEDRSFPKGYEKEYSNRVIYNELYEVKALLRDIPEGQVILAPIYYESFQIPAATSNYVVAISQGNATPASDIERRQACQAQIFKTLNIGLMKQIGVDYVMTRTPSSLHNRIMSDNVHYEQVGIVGDNVLFKVILDDVESANLKECSFRE